MNRFRVGFIFFICVVNAVSYADFDHTHAAWEQILKKYVTEEGPKSTVDYKTLQANSTPLKDYIKVIENTTQAQYNTFNEKEKLAFLINGYNALTVKLVVDNYPVKSIKDIGSFFQSAWKKKFFTLFGQEYYLDGIEHEMLRKQFSEPRIHFSIVCASKGCPQLRGEAYVTTRLEEQLTDQAKRFLQDGTRNYYDAQKNTLYLSKIFKWFKEDFVKKSGSVQNFVASRMAKNVQEEEKIKSADFDTLEYDWTLNETPPRKVSGT